MMQEQAVRMMKEADLEGFVTSGRNSDCVSWLLDGEGGSFADSVIIGVLRSSKPAGAWGIVRYSEEADIIRVADYMHEHESHIRTPSCLKTLWEFPATESNMIRAIELYKELVEIYKRGETRTK